MTLTVVTRFDPLAMKEAMASYDMAAQPRTRSAGLRRTMVNGAIFGVVVVLVIRLGAGFDLQGEHFVAASVGAAVVLAIWFLSAWKPHRTVMQRAVQSAKLNDPQTFEFGPEQVVITSTQAVSTINWSGIGGVTQGRYATILHVGANNIAIPHKDLPDGVTADTFAAQLKTWSGS